MSSTTTTFPPMPLLSITSPTTIENCKNLALRTTDIFICSYPKSGTTWSQHIILTLLLADMRRRGSRETSDRNNNDDDVGVDCYEHVSEYAPFFEIDAHWEELEESNNDDSLLVDTIKDKHDKLGRRVFNTHLRWDMLPKRQAIKQPQKLLSMMTSTSTMTTSDEKHSSNKQQHSSSMPSCGKFIYIVRNLPDVCASFYHHLSNQKEGTYNHDFATFARDWMDGIMPFGSPIHHLLSFAEGFSVNQYCDEDMNIDNYSNYDNNDADRTTIPPRKRGRPLLLLSYERMKTNMLGEVLRIIDFLNLDAISIETLKTEILPTFTFHYMQERSTMFQPKSVTWLNDFQFLRRGIVGDGKRLMMETPAVPNDENNNDHEDNCGGGKGMSLLKMFQDWLNDEEYQLRITNYRLDLATAKRFLAVGGFQG